MLCFQVSFQKFLYLERCSLARVLLMRAVPKEALLTSFFNKKIKSFSLSISLFAAFLSLVWPLTSFRERKNANRRVPSVDLAFFAVKNTQLFSFWDNETQGVQNIWCEILRSENRKSFLLFKQWRGCLNKSFLDFLNKSFMDWTRLQRVKKQMFF